MVSFLGSNIVFSNDIKYQKKRLLICNNHPACDMPSKAAPMDAKSTPKSKPAETANAPSRQYMQNMAVMTTKVALPPV